MRFNKRSRRIRIKKKKKTRTFPLSFLLYLAVGVALLGIFLLMTFGGHERQVRRLRQEKIRGDMNTISAALLLYYKASGQYPTNEQGLQALIEEPKRPLVPENYPSDGYLTHVPLDPWGNPYMYKNLGPEGTYDLVCLGADGRPGGRGEAGDVHLRQ